MEKNIGLSDMDKNLIEAVQIIASMSFGSEFEMSEKDVRNLAIKLIEEE